jgi:putative transposase
VARPLRPQIANGFYHVTIRGNRLDAIFFDDDDRRRFLALLDAVVQRCGWRCHAYCLMTNQAHLLIETPEPNISKGMQRLNGIYARWFNVKYGFVGHLFQGRFASVVVTSESHLLNLARYVVLNPVRAGLVRDPAEWPWSSFLATAGEAARPRFLTVSWLLLQFSPDLVRARAIYSAFVRAGLRRPRPP